jgi:Zn finger protein HypA/HybF involved in hydrogenase expression
VQELSQLPGLVSRAENVARANAATRVKALSVCVGLMSGSALANLRDGFTAAAHGTMLEGARLRIRLVSDISAPEPFPLTLELLEFDFSD